jgi:hypothetical protein
MNTQRQHSVRTSKRVMDAALWFAAACLLIALLTSCRVVIVTSDLTPTPIVWAAVSQTPAPTVTAVTIGGYQIDVIEPPAALTATPGPTLNEYMSQPADGDLFGGNYSIPEE